MDDPCAYGGEIKSIEAVDDHDGQVQPLLPRSGLPGQGSRHRAADLAVRGPDEAQPQAPRIWLEKPVGTGPYKLKEWRKGDQLILEANPDYWGEKAKTDTLVFRWSPEAAQRLLELQSGNVNGIDNPGPG